MLVSEVIDKVAAKEDYLQIISNMSNCGKDAEQVIVDWCKKNNTDHKTQAIENRNWITYGKDWKRAADVWMN